MSTASFFNQRSAPRKTQQNAQNDSERLARMPWVEKYRPKNLDDVSSQNHAVTVLKKSLTTANLPHMLFYGPPGTGKTSTILALAKQLYGPSLYKKRVLELNASDERGILIVREKIKNFARLMVANPTKEDLANYPCPPYKIIILDEADSMTNDAQAALRRTMETYSGVTRFCLICNYITRIIDPLASRCSKFRFKPLDNKDAFQRLTYVAEQEKVQFEDGVLNEILEIAQGDLRKAITFLQSAFKLHSQAGITDIDGDIDIEGKLSDTITVSSVQEIAGIVPTQKIDEILSVTSDSALNSFSQVFQLSKRLAAEGWSAAQITNQLHDRLILDDTLSSEQKIKASIALHETDARLSNGTDEHIQILNFLCKLSQIL